MMTMAIWHGYLCKQCVVSCAHRQKCKQRHQYQTPHSSPGPRVPHPYGLPTVSTLSSLTSHLRNLSSLNVYIIHVITMEDQGGYKSDRCIKIKTIYLNRQKTIDCNMNLLVLLLVLVTCCHIVATLSATSSSMNLCCPPGHHRQVNRSIREQSQLKRCVSSQPEVSVLYVFIQNSGNTQCNAAHCDLCTSYVCN